VDFEESRRTIIGARNRVGRGLSYRSARLHRLAESIPGLLKFKKIPSLQNILKIFGLKNCLLLYMLFLYNITGTMKNCF
jgi:hypothetical protein